MSPKYKDCKGIQVKASRSKNSSFRAVAAMNLGLLVILLTGLIYYVILMNGQATSGYRTAELSKKFEELKELNQRMEVEIIELGQIDRLESQAVAMKMEPAGQIDYLIKKENQVAMGEGAQRDN